MKRMIIPKRIVLFDKVDGVHALLIDKPTQSSCVLDERNYTYNPDFNSSCVLHEGGYVLLDFGREIHGGVVLCTRGISTLPNTGKVRLVFGESVMEALSHIGYKGATNDHAIRDTVLDISAMGNLFYGNTGFRFVKIEAVVGDITLKSVKAELHTRADLAYLGSFECSDARLNEIWKTAAYTVELNTGEYIWDGIKRDRLVWLGDMNPEISTILSVFGADRAIKNSLDLARAETSPHNWINTIPSYSAWWVINQYELYLHTADEEYLRSSFDYAKAILLHIFEVVCADYSCDEFHFFVDWSSNDDPSAKRVGFYAVAYMAFSCGAKIADTLGEEETVKLCKQGMAKIESLNLEIPDQKQMAGLAACSGLKSPKVVNTKVLSRGGVDGLSTFMGYYVLTARAKADDVGGALDMIREYWGAMLDLGATAFWEDFDIRWSVNAARIDEPVPDGKVDIHGDCGKYCYTGYRHSLCHGWASGPCAFLSRYVLGVRFVAPDKVEVMPNLAGLEWARGTYPTRFGNISVNAKIVDGTMQVDVNVPDGIELVFNS